MTRNRWLLFLFRLVVGGVFIWAGALKVADPLGFDVLHPGPIGNRAVLPGWVLELPEQVRLGRR